MFIFKKILYTIYGLKCHIENSICVLYIIIRMPFWQLKEHIMKFFGQTKIILFYSVIIIDKKKKSFYCEELLIKVGNWVPKVTIF